MTEILDTEVANGTTNQSMAEVLDECFEENLGKGWLECREDNSGAYMTSRGGYWHSPKVTASITEQCLEEAGFDVQAMIQAVTEEEIDIEGDCPEIVKNHFGWEFDSSSRWDTMSLEEREDAVDQAKEKFS